MISPPSRKGNHADDNCYIELTLKQAKINFAQIREVCKIDSENQQAFWNGQGLYGSRIVRNGIQFEEIFGYKTIKLNFGCFIVRDNDALL